MENQLSQMQWEHRIIDVSLRDVFPLIIVSARRFKYFNDSFYSAQTQRICEKRGKLLGSSYDSKFTNENM